MGSPPMPPSYGGMSPPYYQPLEGMLTRRNVFALNALGLIGIYLALLFRLASSDLNVRGLAHFLAISGGMLGAFASLAGGLGSKRTSDMQNLGLLVWAGLLLSFTFAAFTWI
jgi:drug/metabolite transporter (DMT)-like permease